MPEAHLKAPLRQPDLYGLVLAGGQSTRMGREKALLRYEEKPQWQNAKELLIDQCAEVYLSVNAEQTAFKQEKTICDQFDAIGPLGGILSAMHTHPQKAWLVIACDMPFLSAQTLSTLIKNRSPQAQATVFLNAENQLEPLCAIYEPSLQKQLTQAAENKNYSLRRALAQAAIHTLQLPEGHALDNANTPEEYQVFKKRIQS